MAAHFSFPPSAQTARPYGRSGQTSESGALGLINMELPERNQSTTEKKSWQLNTTMTTRPPPDPLPLPHLECDSIKQGAVLLRRWLEHSPNPPTGESSSWALPPIPIFKNEETDSSLFLINDEKRKSFCRFPSARKWSQGVGLVQAHLKNSWCWGPVRRETGSRLFRVTSVHVPTRSLGYQLV